MSRPVSFSRQVKDELCRVGETETCCRQMEVAGALASAARFRPDRVTISTGHAEYAHRLIGLMASLYDFGCEMRQGSELLTLTFAGQEPCDRLFADMRRLLGFDRVQGSVTAEALESDCCLRAALRGIFLACGSISEPQSAYHLELAVHRGSVAALALNLLGQVDIRGGLLSRNGYSLIYLKEGQQISDFLLQTGAHESLLLFESLRVDKEMRNSVNRVVNCDNANSQRIANTSARQLQLLHELESTHGLGLLPDELQEAARARLDNPDLSLRELGELMSPPIGKSGMNHRLRKLEVIAAGLLESGDPAAGGLESGALAANPASGGESGSGPDPDRTVC